MQKEYTYSVIIPHKNIPKLLQRCLDSIPQREDLEVIVVDDNSDPAVVDFDNFPGKNRSNTTVIFDKSGKGAGRARNIGLENAHGKWLLFADSDDMFLEDIGKLLSKLQFTSDETDIVYFDVQSFDCEKNILTDEASYFHNSLLKASNSNVDDIRFAYDVPWGKAVRHSMIIENNIAFEEVKFSNDTRFSALCGHFAKKVEIFPVVIYQWVTRDNSLWRRIDKEWCVVRTGVSIRLSVYLKKLGNYKASYIYENSAFYYLGKLEEISFSTSIKWYLYLGVRFRHFGLLFVIIPKKIFSFFLKKIHQTTARRCSKTER